MSCYRFLANLWLIGATVTMVVTSIQDYRVFGWRGLAADIPQKILSAVIFPIVLPSYNWKQWKRDLRKQHRKETYRVS